MESHPVPGSNDSATGCVDLVVLGVQIRIAGTGMEFEEAMRDLIDPDPSDPDVNLRIATWGDGLALLNPDGSPVSISPAGQNPLPHFLSVLNMLGLDGDIDRLHVHAALVDLAGRGIVLCGPSGAGKSTLAAALVELGAGYLTDETIGLVLGSRTIQSYPKPFIFKGWARKRFGLEQRLDDTRIAVRGSRFGTVFDASVCHEVVFPTFREGADLAFTRISPARAVDLVVQESLDIKRFGPEALLAIADMVARAACWQLTYGDVDQAAAAVAAQAATDAEPSSWAMTHLDRRTCTVRLDGAELTLDAEGQKFEWRAHKHTTSVQLSARSSVALDVFADVAGSLADAGIRFLVSGDALALIDGPLLDVDHTWFGPSLVVGPSDLVQARLLAEKVAGPQFGDEVVGHAGVAESESLFDLVERAAVPVRLGARWHMGVHPRHRFLLAAIQNSFEPGSVSSATINTLGRLPQRMLRNAFDEASRLGLLRELRSSVATAAAEASGATRAVVEAYRET